MNEIFRFQAFSTLFIASIQLITLILVGRILGAYALGLYAVFQFIFRIGLAIFEPGMAISIVQKQSYSTILLQKIKMIQWKYWLGLVIIIGFWYLYQSDKSFNFLFVVLIAILLLFILASLSHTNSLMIYHGKQKEIMYAQLISHLVEFLVLISLILYIESIWAFCISLCCRFLCYYLICLFQTKSLHEYILNIELNETNSHISFSNQNILYQLMGAFSGNLDTVIVGAMYGLPTLGIYNLACEFSYIPFSKINPIFNKAIFPITSAWNKHENIDTSKIWTPIETYMFVMLGIYSFLFYNVPVILPLLFKNTSLDLQNYARLFLFIAFLKGLNNIVFTYILAKGISDKLLKWNLVNLLLNMTIFILCYICQWNASNLLLASTIYSFGFLIYSFIKFTDEYLFNWNSNINSVWRIICFTLLICISLYLINEAQLNLYVSILLQIIIIALTLYLTNKNLFLRLLKIQITH